MEHGPSCEEKVIKGFYKRHPEFQKRAIIIKRVTRELGISEEELFKECYKTLEEIAPHAEMRYRANNGGGIPHSRY